MLPFFLHHIKVGTHKGEVGTHEGGVGTHEGGVGTHKGEIGTHEGEAGTHDQYSLNLEKRRFLSMDAKNEVISSLRYQASSFQFEVLDAMKCLSLSIAK